MFGSAVNRKTKRDFLRGKPPRRPAIEARVSGMASQRRAKASLGRGNGPRGRSKASPGHGMASPGHGNGSLGRGIASLGRGIGSQGRTNASRCRPNAPRRGAIASPGRANRSRVRRGAAGCDRAGRSDCCKTPLARAREPVHRVSSLRRGRVLRKQFSARVSTPRSFVSSALMRSPYEYKVSALSYTVFFGKTSPSL